RVVSDPCSTVQLIAGFEPGVGVFASIPSLDIIGRSQVPCSNSPRPVSAIGHVREARAILTENAPGSTPHPGIFSNSTRQLRSSPGRSITIPSAIVGSVIVPLPGVDRPDGRCYLPEALIAADVRQGCSNR